MTDDPTNKNQNENANCINEIESAIFNRKKISFYLGLFTLAGAVLIGLFIGYTNSSQLSAYKVSSEPFRVSSGRSSYKPNKLYNIGDTASDDNFEYKVSKVEFNQQNDNTYISNNSNVLVVHMEIKNVGKVTKKYDSYDMRLFEVSDLHQDSNIHRNISETTIGSLHPGQKGEISLVFEVPKDKTDFVLICSPKNSNTLIRFKVGISRQNVSI